MIQADPKVQVQFTQPVRQILIMLLSVAIVSVGVYFAYPAVAPIFLASPYLNGFILIVFIIGVAACFRQVLTLINSVSWIEGFALDRPGHDLVAAPSLLAPLAALLRKRGARAQLTSTSTRSILESVATRLDEGRDITRYIINLLIFLGLLGTFYGLAVTVPAVVDTIRSLAPQDGADSLSVFDNLMTGLESQLAGMGTAFGSSLLGLAGSLVVGLLELFAGHGQNRFYRELEDWMSSITKLGISSGESTGDGVEGGSASLAGFVEYSTLQFDKLQDILAELRDRRTEQDQRLDQLSKAVEQLIDYSVKGQEGTQNLLTQVTDGNARLAGALSEGDGIGLDADSRTRLRNIDGHLLRLLEEINVGRSDATAELRGDLAELTAAIKALTKAAG